MRPKRIFRPYWQLEEHEHGMWRYVPPADCEGFVAAAAALMQAPDRFEAAMVRALAEWPMSVEVAMTTESLNRRAWFGHAGCCIGVGSPEHLTRLGWHRLTPAEQEAANDAADRVIDRWELGMGLRHDDLQIGLFDA
jgi:hypothetical protein